MTGPAADGNRREGAAPADDRWAPKVHPLTREATDEDPFELMAEPVPGDPLVMLECMLQEFAWMGYTAEQLVALFHHPGYPVLCQLREHFGAEAVEQKVREMIAAWGVLQFQETLAEPEPVEEELVQIMDLTGRNSHG